MCTMCCTVYDKGGWVVEVTVVVVVVVVGVVSIR